MSELDIIKQTKRVQTVNSLYQDLLALGIEENDTLLVHSSLSKIGWVCGGAYAVCLALLKAVNKGSVVMPSQSSSNSDPLYWGNPPVPKEWLKDIYENMPAFDVSSVTTNMGTIAEQFRVLDGSIRSNHPKVSFCAHGCLSKEIISNHVLTPGFGLESPLGKLYEINNSKILLLGVGYDKCTSFHLSEVLIQTLNKVKDGSSMLIDGVRQWVEFEDFDYDSTDFEALGKAFEEFGVVVQGQVGQADCKLFDLKKAVDFAVCWLKENRNIKDV